MARQIKLGDEPYKSFQRRAGMSKRKPIEHVQYHRDGRVWARGQTLDGVPTGYWEWFRVDGIRMRSGYFDNGDPTGEWTTYDKSGALYKVTKKKPKPAKSP